MPIRPIRYFTIHPGNKPLPLDIGQLKEFAGELDQNKRAADAHKGAWAACDNAYYMSVLSRGILEVIERLERGGSIPETHACDAKPSKDIPLRSEQGDEPAPQFFCEDILSVAARLKEHNSDAHVCLFSPENSEAIGGGVFGGAPNLEEALCRAMPELAPSLLLYAVRVAENLGQTLAVRGGRPQYPTQLNDNQAHFTNGLTVRNKIVPRPGQHWYRVTYEDCVPFEVSVVGNAAQFNPDKRGFAVHGGQQETLFRVKAQLSAMAQNRVTHAVLTDFGCGAFNNRPDEIATLYCDALYGKGGFARHFDGISFAIAHPGNKKAFEKAFIARLKELGKGHAPPEEPGLLSAVRGFVGSLWQKTQPHSRGNAGDAAAAPGPRE